MESGRDALSIVAEGNGMWSWCFIGPDAKNLPLVAGGSGSVEEMKACLASHTEHAVIFGLLRLSFGSGKMRRSKFVFIVASNEESEVVKTAVVTGKAMSQRGEVEKVFATYVQISVTMEVKRASDLSLDSIVEGVSKKVIIDGAHNKPVVAAKGAEDVGAVFNASAIADAAAEEKAAREAAAAEESPPHSEHGDDAHEDLEDDEELKQEVQSMAHEFHRAATGRLSLVPGAQVALGPEGLSLLESVVEGGEDAPVVAPVAVAPVEGDDQPWSEDRSLQLESQAGDEERFVAKDIVLDKGVFDSVAKAVEALNSGSATAAKGFCVVITPEDKFFLLYQKGSDEHPLSFKFSGIAATTPQDVPAAASSGKQEPKEISGNSGMIAPPPDEPPVLCGLLLKQATNFFAEWQLRYFEIVKGKIRYWPDLASQIAGYRPKYEYSLLNATVALIKSSDSRFQLTLKGSKAMERAPYLLMANIAAVATQEEAKYRHTRDEWVLALVQHTVYAKKDLAFRRAAAVVQRSLAPGS